MNNYEDLSEREKEVLKLYTLGKHRSQIARILIVSHATVCSHLSNIFNKLGVNNKEKASIIYWQNNLSELENISPKEMLN